MGHSPAPYTIVLHKDDRKWRLWCILSVVQVAFFLFFVFCVSRPKTEPDKVEWDCGKITCNAPFGPPGPRGGPQRNWEFEPEPQPRGKDESPLVYCGWECDVEGKIPPTCEFVCR